MSVEKADAVKPCFRDAREWPRRKKYLTTLAVSMFKAISGLASSSIVPSLVQIGSDFGTPPGVQQALPLSIFFLGYTLGLLVIGPLAETFGRVGMLQGSNVFFIVFNTAAGFSNSNVMLCVMRALMGFGAAGPLALGGGILHDCYTAEERTNMITVYALPAQLTPAIGPILGAVCEEYLSWRWPFFIISIASILVQVLAFAVVQESYKPVIERRLVAAEQRALGYPATDRRTEAKEHLGRLRANIFRPFEILTKHPLAQLLALYVGVVYGLQYLLISSLSQTWTDQYGQSLVLGSLNYLALGVGFVAGAQATRPLNRRIYAYLKQRDAEGKGRPEYRLPMIAIGAGLIPVGLLWYGWSAAARVFPVVPDLGVFVFAAGAVAVLNITSLYLVDVYGKGSASATGAVYILRALGGFAFPLFAHQLYDTLGLGWGNSVVALASVCLGGPLPLLLWKYGAQLRVASASG